MIRQSYRLLKRASYLGPFRYCPICRIPSRRFRPFGRENRPDVQCPFCGSLERHRLQWLFLSDRTRLFSSDETCLHIAPAPCLEKKLKALLGKRYLTADLFQPRAMVKMDITDIQFPDGQFDCVICSHVLEHVDDDRKALSELFRVLRKGGWAIILVPIDGDITIEDPSIVDPTDRLRVFGQEDHVRQYGRDYIERLRGAGFHVTVFAPSDLVTGPKMIDKLRLDTHKTGDIYYCQKH